MNSNKNEQDTDPQSVNGSSKESEVISQSNRDKNFIDPDDEWIGYFSQEDLKRHREICASGKFQDSSKMSLQEWFDFNK